MFYYRKLVPPVPLAPFLDRLAPDDAAELLGLGRRRQYPAQSILFFEGDDVHDVVLVRAGELKVAVALDEREVVLEVVGPGDILGELAAIDGRPRSARAVTLTVVEVVVVPAASFRTFLGGHPEAALALMQHLAGRLRRASRRQVELGALDSTARVCGRLVDLMARYGRPAGPGVLIRGPLNQSDIAAWAGLSREAVVKALNRLRAVGWVTTTPRTITVLDVPAVTTRAGGAARQLSTAS